MKILILSMLVLSFNAFSQSLLEQHEAECETPEARALVGANGGGSCRIVIGVEKKDIPFNFCAGKLDKVPCMVEYVSNSEMAALRLTCGDAEQPLFQQAIPASALSYNVSALIKTEQGKETVLNVNKSYVYFESMLLNLVMTQEGDQKTAKISIGMMGQVDYLTDVVCAP